jgi:hypothetical protein
MMVKILVSHFDDLIKFTRTRDTRERYFCYLEVSVQKRSIDLKGVYKL